MKAAFVVGTFDTKAEELLFVCDRLRAQVGESRRALGLATERFRSGVSDFLEVLTAQRTVLQAEQALADATTSVSTDLVALYKALGGGWEAALPR